jgi:tripartite-type tricarboxylate transporter receptor subunit TctC
MKSSMKSAVKLAAPLLAALAAAFVFTASAQDYPNKPVKVVVPTPPGGSVDGVARIVTAKMAEIIGRTFPIENRGGASTTLGADMVAKSAPDGYTLYINASIHSINPYVLKSLPYDAVKDFTAIAELARGPLLFTVHPSVPAKTVKELIAVVKADPAKYNFATTGFGSAGHLAIALFRARAGLDVPIILYKGAGPAIQEMIGGQVQALIDPALSSGPQVKSGKLRPLAITSSRRSPVFPDIPTVVEAGMPELEFYSWYGLWGPAGLPPAIVAKLEDAAIKAVQSPEVRDKLSGLGFEPTGHTATEFSKFIASEVAKYSRIIKEANIQQE